MVSIRKKILPVLLLFSISMGAQTRTILKLDLTEKSLPFGLKELASKSLPKIGLALSGGGARSISQLGVLKTFEEKNIPIDIIVGTSMGSIVGGLYSAGYSLADLDSIMMITNWNSFFSAQQSNRNDLFVDQKITEDRAVVSFRLDGLKPIIPTSLSSGQRAANFLNLMALNAPFHAEDSYDNLKFKFRAISTDLVYGKEVIIDKGPLELALRASSSVTLLLPPVKKDSLLLVDGGLVANIPVIETRELGADLVIAVDTSSPLYTEEELNYPWIIADQLVSIPMRILNNQQLSEADFVICPELNARKNSDFTNLADLISKGYESSVLLVDKIALEHYRLFKSKINVEEKVFYNLSLSDNPTGLEKIFFAGISNEDSVSNKYLLYKLNDIIKIGDWKDISLVIDETAEKSILKIIAVENSKVLGTNIVGVSADISGEALKRLNLLINHPFNPQKTLRAALDILRYYKKLGYSTARIETVYFDEQTGVLHVKLNGGRITKISVEGNMRTKEKLITREFKFGVGDYFRYDLAEKGLADLRSTNLFDQIDLLIIPNDDGAEFKIKVVEKVSNVIRLGLRFDNEYQAQFSLDLRDENFNGTGTEIGATISGGIKNRIYGIEQKANRVFESYLTYKVRAFYEFNNVNSYRDDIATEDNEFSRSKTGEYRQLYYGGSFAIGTQVERFGNLFAEARYQRDEIKDISNYSGSIYHIDVSSLRLSLFVDSQNEYPYPTVGFLIRSYYETAQTAFGGDVSYTKFFFDYKNIITYRSINTLSVRTVIGFADKTLPLSRQFSLGGQNSFFGLRENEFRGRQIFLASLEYRNKLPFKLFFDAYIKARYDLGAIWEEREQIRLKDLRHGVGATLSLNTPIGPADFSIGKSFYLKNTLANNTIVWGPTFFYFTIGYYY